MVIGAFVFIALGYALRKTEEIKDMVRIEYSKTYNERTQLSVILAVNMKVAEFFRSCGDSGSAIALYRQSDTNLPRRNLYRILTRFTLQ